MRRQWPGLVVGAAVGFVLAVVVGAIAPDRDRGDGRYELHVWSANPSVVGDSAQHGAYRLDRLTGEVCEINTNNAVTKVSFPQSP